MLTIILQIAATYALWFGLTQSNTPVVSTIVDKLAEKSEGFQRFFMCPICSGFWCSLVVALLLLRPESIGDGPMVVVYALAGATGNFLIETLVTRLQQR